MFTTKLLPLTAALSLLSLLACGPQETDEPVNDTSQTVKVSYLGTSTDVSLGKPATVDLGGSPHVRHSDVIKLALPDKDLSTVGAGFRSADGFDPSSKAACQAVLPVSGDTLSKGYLDPETRLLKWDDSLQFPTCLSVRDTAEILLTDK